MWKVIRIFVLVVSLIAVVQQTVLEEADLDWKKGFYVAVFPINADGSKKVARYIKRLQLDDFDVVSDYFAREGKRYGLGLRRPIEIQLGKVIEDIPPAPPMNGSILDVMLWSLKFRYYGWKHNPKFDIKPEIKLYLLYHDPDTTYALSHSTALNKGRIGRINLFGDRMYHQRNMVVTAHELLHTVKATDKYNINNTLPRYPDGYAEPNKKPLYPQVLAELMGGRVPLTKKTAEMPKNLSFTLIGKSTAQEIGWIK